MNDIIKEVLAVDSWPQVAVLALGLLYLIARQWIDSRRISRVADDTKQVAADSAVAAHELQNNSGKSVKDITERTERAVTELAAAFDAHLTDARDKDAVLDQLRDKYL